MKMLSSEKGSALFFILIAVVLFAALSYAVSNMMRGGMSGGSTSISQEKAQIYAGEILDYTRILRQTVQNLRISNGCRDTEISFEGAGGGPAYTHTPAASDDCKVFGPSGGDIAYLAPNSDVLATSIPSGNSAHGDFYFFDQFVTGIGTAGGAELLVRLRYLSKSVCTAINDRLGITNPGDDAPADVNFSSVQAFDGDYFSVPGGANTIDTPQTQGAMVACVQMTGFAAQNGYYFYQVLVAR